MAKQSKAANESGLVRLSLWHSFFYFHMILHARKKLIYKNRISFLLASSSDAVCEAKMCFGRHQQAVGRRIHTAPRSNRTILLNSGDECAVLVCVRCRGHGQHTQLSPARFAQRPLELAHRARALAYVCFMVRTLSIAVNHVKHRLLSVSSFRFYTCTSSSIYHGMRPIYGLW